MKTKIKNEQPSLSVPQRTRTTASVTSGRLRVGEWQAVDSKEARRAERRDVAGMADAALAALRAGKCKPFPD